MARFFLVVVALLGFCVPAWAEKDIRVALVVGNGAYQNAEPLKNPVNDARAMAKVLRDAGFEVIQRENLTRRAFVEALYEFSGKVPPGGVGLFYYAGHGIQVRGANHLVPIDAALANERDVKYETIDLNDVLSGLDEARARLSLVILDACRDNPFARRFRSANRGLAQTDAPRGTVIAYATAPGDTAADGDGENGLYTAELLKAIAQPGLKLEEVFKRTIDGVARASGNKQTPWVSSSFRGEFVFNAAINIPPPAPPPPVVAVPAPPSVDPVEQTAWTTIASSNNPAMFELFLKRFPNGVYSDFARARLEELKMAAALEDKRRSAAADEAKARAAAEEAKRLAAADEAKRKADAEATKEEARRVAAAEDAKRKADADARRAADEEAKRTAAAEEAKRRAAAEEEKKSVENAEAALKLADIDRKRIQAALTAKGFDTLGTDGSFGPRTRQMIGNWQRSRNEPSTGFLTATQAALLSQEGQSALAKIEDERRKADDEKRKADAERAKAEAERQKAAPPPPPPQQAATPGPLSPSAPPLVPAGPNGTWRLTWCFQEYQDSRGFCGNTSAQIVNGRVSATIVFSSSPSPPVTINAVLSPNGRISGTGDSITPPNTWGAAAGTPFSVQLSGTWSGNTGSASGVTPRGRPVSLRLVGG
jgi:peptidoglycan hydrolase-like protein with peptidoglycan-binding domain